MRQIYWEMGKVFQSVRKLNSSKSWQVFITNHYDVIDFEFHGFCDASVEVYSASVYVRLSKNDIITTNLVTAKLKIVPRKKLTVSRLELMSCLFEV